MRYLLFIPLFLLTACGGSKKAGKPEAPNTPFQTTVLPDDPTLLWASDGNITADTVILNCQGGPASAIKFLEAGRSNLRTLPNYENYHIAYLHQAQTYNPSLYNFENDFSFELAKMEVDKSVEIIARSVSHFKEAGKTVILIGTAYGAFLIQDYLATGKAKADKYILIAGRLDMNLEMIEEYKKGNMGEFFEDGETFIPEFEPTPIPPVTFRDKKTLLNNRLKAAASYKRYTTALEGIDLSNVAYFYAKKDQHVGSLTEAEVKFLLSNNARVFPTNDSHSETFYRFIDAVTEGRLGL